MTAHKDHSLQNDVFDAMKTRIFDNEGGVQNVNVMLNKHGASADPTIGVGLSMNKSNWANTQKYLMGAGITKADTLRIKAGQMPITQQQLADSFELAFADKLKILERVNPNFMEMPLEAITAQMDLVYQTGAGFKKTNKAIKKGDFHEASHEVKRVKKKGATNARNQRRSDSFRAAENR